MMQYSPDEMKTIQEVYINALSIMEADLRKMCVEGQIQHFALVSLSSMQAFVISYDGLSHVNNKIALDKTVEKLSAIDFGGITSAADAQEIFEQVASLKRYLTTAMT